MRVGRHNTHIAVTTYATYPELQIGYQTRLDTNSFNTLLGIVTKPHGSLNLIDALTQARLGVLPTGRPFVPKAVVFFTNGVDKVIPGSNKRKIRLIRGEAAKLHRKAVTYVVRLEDRPYPSHEIMSQIATKGIPILELVKNDRVLIRDLVMRYCGKLNHVFLYEQFYKNMSIKFAQNFRTS